MPSKLAAANRPGGEVAMYLVFIGDGSTMDDPDWSTLEVRTDSWDIAKLLLLKKLDAFKDDDCETCRENAAQAAAKLRDAKPGNFEAEVDGDDYMIFYYPKRWGKE
jgi:hypothetical protein